MRIQTSSPWMFEDSPATRQTGESYLINSEIVGIQEIFLKATNGQDIRSVTSTPF